MKRLTSVPYARLWLTALIAAALGSRSVPVSSTSVSDPEVRQEFFGPSSPTGGVIYFWTVPANVARVRFEVYGAQGGDMNCVPRADGGLGGLTVATLSVIPGEVLLIIPGGRGGSVGVDVPCNPEAPFDTQAPGGFNGGAGAGRMVGNVWSSAGGGGGSDVRRYPYGLADRILTAGGGGGGASTFASLFTDDRAGGVGGGTAGFMGLGNGQGGLGGTQTTGGAAGARGGGGQDGDPGSFGSGGQGGDADEFAAAGGGGGGGWYGGGGGGSGALTGGGGGGGSGHGPSDAVLTSGVHAGTGRVVAIYQVDTQPPVLNLPAPITTNATSPAGAIVIYAFSASDPSGVASSSCTPATGSTFPIGTTTVNCSATDAFGQTTTGSFSVTVLDDTTPPVLNLPAAITTDATSPAGAVVSYSFSASDPSGVASSSCTPAAGSTFPIGTTTVNCSATDTFGNNATGSFNVTVKGAAEQLADLIGLLDSYNLGKLGSSLLDKLTSVQRMLNDGKLKQACDNLQSFLSQVEAQSGRGLEPERANELRRIAERIEAVIGC